MTKLRAPFYSFEASGKLSTTYVARKQKVATVISPWKKPWDPKSPAQIIQRSYYQDALAHFYASDFTWHDKAAWAHFSKTLGKQNPGYQAFMGFFMDLARQGNVWQLMSHVTITNITQTTATVTVRKSVGGWGPILWLGYRPGVFFRQCWMQDNFDGTWFYNLTTLKHSHRYYITIEVGVKPTYYGRVGYYPFHTVVPWPPE